MDVERLIEQHKNAVYRQLVRMCGNETDAEDALAEAFISAIRASDQLHDPSAFRAWLAQIGRRVCLRMKSRGAILSMISIDELSWRGIEIPGEMPTPEIQAEVRDTKSCIEGVIASLPESYRDVYMRREIYGDKAQAVARELGLSLPNVKSRLHRARHMVRAALDRGLCGAEV